MSGTFSQIYIQIIFAVKERQNLIQDSWKNDLYKYIAGIIKGKKQKPIIVNGMPDHVHAFVGNFFKILSYVRNIFCRSTFKSFLLSKKDRI